MPWQTLSKEKLDENPFWEHWRDRYRMPSGKEGMYDYHVNRGAVSVFVQGKDGRFVMLKEYRYLFGKPFLTHIGGFIEPGDTPEEAARKEVLEETGYRAGRVTHLARAATAPAFSKECVDVFLATDLEFVGQQLEDTEVIETVLMTAQEIDEAIRQGQIEARGVMGDWLLVKLFLKI